MTAGMNSWLIHGTSGIAGSLGGVAGSLAEYGEKFGQAAIK